MWFDFVKQIFIADLAFNCETLSRDGLIKSTLFLMARGWEYTFLR